MDQPISQSSVKTHSEESISSNASTLSINPYYELPIVLLDGFLCHSNFKAFHNFTVQLRSTFKLKGRICPPIIQLEGGGTPSAYDIAVDVFYQLKGGVVDYGLEHSRKHNHSRYGRTYKVGLYPNWSAENPVHLLAHSFGGSAILVLQKLLELKHFKDKLGNVYDTNSSWIRSIATISSPFRGSTSVLHLGHTPYKPLYISSLSFKKFIYVSSYILEWVNSKRLTDLICLDHRTSHFSITREHIGFLDLIKLCLSDKTIDVLDNSSYDCNFERYLDQKNVIEPSEHIFYRSYATTMTNLDLNTMQQVPMQHWNLPLVLLGYLMGKTDLKAYKNLTFEEKVGWQSNDGLVNLISQFHPNRCVEKKCRHVDVNKYFSNYDDVESEDLKSLRSNSSSGYDININLERGIWYTSTIHNCSHVDIVPGYKVVYKFSNLVMKVFNWLGLSRFTSIKNKFEPTITEKRLVEVVEDYSNFLVSTDQF